MYIYRGEPDMQIGVAEARLHWRQLLDRVHTGESVEITRRGAVVAVLSPPPGGEAGSLVRALSEWRDRWQVDEWADDDAFAQVRDTSSGRESPW
jgi:prevent-host-death family protein